MGNDGGSIPTRRELVKNAARNQTHSELRTSQAQYSQYHWTYCALSKRPLSSPVVSDHLGWLYNKDAIIEWLLKRTDAFGDGEETLKDRGINGLKDVVQVHFQILDSTPGEDSNGNQNQSIELIEGGERKERWVCPITRKELGVGSRAVYLVPCGHAFTEGAISQTVVKGKEDESERDCLECGVKYNKRDVININPVAEADITRLQDRMKDLQALGLTHSLKKGGEKSKKRKNRENGESKTTPIEENKPKKKTSNINHSATASLTSKVLAEEENKGKMRKVELNDNLKSLFSNKTDDKDRAKGKGGGDFMTRGYTLPSRR